MRATSELDEIAERQRQADERFQGSAVGDALHGELANRFTHLARSVLSLLLDVAFFGLVLLIYRGYSWILAEVAGSQLPWWAIVLDRTMLVAAFLPALMLIVVDLMKLAGKLRRGRA